ncbi:hypothetical protein J3F83DRAFT_108864 [Trichoderma novae-zelandiae]
MDEDRVEETQRRRTIGIGRARAVGGNEAPFVAGCLHRRLSVPPLLQAVQPLDSVALTQEAGPGAKLQICRRWDKQPERPPCLRFSGNGGSRRIEARKAGAAANESNFASARRRCFPGRQGIRGAAVAGGWLSSACVFLLYFLGEKRQQRSLTCR